MKFKFLFITFLLLPFIAAPAMSETIHPIDKQEQECISQVKDLNARTVCTMKAARAWNFEVDRYYSLLYKKLPESARTTLFDDQKYWNMYKNNEYKILDSLKDAQNDTLSSVIFRSEQKRNLIKNRAQDLRMYYIQTFPDDEQEKIKTETAQDGFRLDPVLQRSLRWLGF